MNTLYLGLANFSLCKGFRVGSGNISNSAQFVLILQARIYLPPTAPLVCFSPRYPPPFYNLGKSGKTVTKERILLGVV